MEGFKGTEGPWVIDNNLDGVKCIWGVEGSRICSMNHISSESEANAHLISTAPELLEALDNLIGYFCDFTPSEKEAKLKAKAAIAKALGKEATNETK